MSHHPFPLSIWHVVIAGFLQTRGSDHGMSRLWGDLHREHVIQPRIIRGRPGAPVEYLPSEAVAVPCRWNDDFAGLAEQIWRLGRDESRAPAVYVYAYSWGGTSAMRFADELGQRDLRVRRMVLSDAVYHHWHRLGNWRTILPWSKIRVPCAVDEVDWFRQVTDWPRGHDVVAEDPEATIMHKPVIVPNVGHRYMDDSRVFQDKCRWVAGAA